MLYFYVLYKRGHRFIIRSLDSHFSWAITFVLLWAKIGWQKWPKIGRLLTVLHVGVEWLLYGDEEKKYFPLNHQMAQWLPSKNQSGDWFDYFHKVSHRKLIYHVGLKALFHLQLYTRMVDKDRWHIIQNTTPYMILMWKCSIECVLPGILTLVLKKWLIYAINGKFYSILCRVN